MAVAYTIRMTTKKGMWGITEHYIFPKQNFLLENESFHWKISGGKSGVS